MKSRLKVTLEGLSRSESKFAVRFWYGVLLRIPWFMYETEILYLEY